MCEWPLSCERRARIIVLARWAVELAPLRALPKTGRSRSVHELINTNRPRVGILTSKVSDKGESTSRMEVFGRVVSLGVLLFQFEGNAPEMIPTTEIFRSLFKGFFQGVC
jgi:hypothetical protein